MIVFSDSGAGEVYLVIVTSTNLSVYSLLTLKTLWTFDAMEISSSAVAMDERFIALVQDSPTMSVGEEGWIAIAVSNRAKKVNHVVEDDTEKKGKKTTTKGKGKKTVVNVEEVVASSASHKILVFSPLSSTPLSTTHVHSKVISLDFLTPKPLIGQSSISGVIGITVDSELFVVSSQSQTPLVTANGTKQVALVKNAVLPILATATGKLLLAKKEMESAERPVYNPSLVSRSQANQNWLQGFLPELTEDLPRPSDIAGEYPILYCLLSAKFG
jgi:hypothetical protein